uniref:SVWC domain-containing protein n=1 Tax=Steinernema glaseri TaxID=37863 RepID=A0A1I7ZJG0_9BILA
MKIHLLVLVSFTLLLVAVNGYKECYKTHALLKWDPGCPEGYYERDSVRDTVRGRTYRCCPNPVSEPSMEQKCIEKLASFSSGEDQECPSGYYKTWKVFPLMQCCMDYRDDM